MQNVLPKLITPFCAPVFDASAIIPRVSSIHVSLRLTIFFIKYFYQIQSASYCSCSVSLSVEGYLGKKQIGLVQLGSPSLTPVEAQVCLWVEELGEPRTTLRV